MMADALTFHDVHARCLRVLELVAPVLGKEGPLTPGVLDDMRAVEKHLAFALSATRGLRAAFLRGEWGGICNAMASGYWPGTEAEALARIEEIKMELAKIEVTQ